MAAVVVQDVKDAIRDFGLRVGYAPVVKFAIVGRSADIAFKAYKD